jgi:DNA-binding CsgD family transcriptional regulator
MAQGLSNEELGRRLFLAPSTVKTHVNRIFRKLGVTSRVNAVLEFQRLTRPPAPDAR